MSFAKAPESPRPTTPSTSFQQIESRCFGYGQSSRRQEVIRDVSNRLVGSSSVMPSIYIHDQLIQARHAPALSLNQRYERLKKAAKLYLDSTLAGLDRQSYIDLATRVSGLPESVISQSLINIADGLYSMKSILQAATPAGATWELDEPAMGIGCSLFSRKGDVVSIIAAGNGPGTHGLWPQAIAMGYRTFVKPSSREPFTAQRLVCALEQAGLSDYVGLIPTDHNGAQVMILHSDLAIVYGGADVAAKYERNPSVLVQGPGRSKVVIGKDITHEAAIDVVIASIMSLGGASCVSASAILVENDPEGFAALLRKALAESATQTPRFACQQDAERIRSLLLDDDSAWGYETAPDSRCVLLPHVALVGKSTDPKVQRELPFPCVTVAPFDRVGFQALSNSLVVTVLSNQKTLIHPILNDHTIANVYIGNIPTTWMNYRVPHDGYLADFLMCNRGVRVERACGDL